MTTADARYPVRFEMLRLEALGEPAYLASEDARARYDSGHSLNVVSHGEPPPWHLIVGPQRHRFTVTSSTERRTPLQVATWERDGEELFLRRTSDLFYPDGDPGGGVPFSEAVEVRREVSPDGVVEVTMSSPRGDDDLRRASGVPVDGFRAPTPPFGSWERLVAAAESGTWHRFGLESIAAALALVDEMVPRGSAADVSAGEWRVGLTERDILRAVEALTSAGALDGRARVLDRGSLRILPLLLQSVVGRSDVERAAQARRASSLAARVSDALEQQAGRGIRADLDSGVSGSLASYAAALTAAGATEAVWWTHEQAHGIVLVTSADDASGTRSLAVHVVPVSWVLERRADRGVDGIDARWSWDDLAG